MDFIYRLPFLPDALEWRLRKNFQTFSELASSFSLTYQIVYQALGFSLVMECVGGVLPVVRASRMKIVDSLRAS
jgi:putative ABC transport system permease protein